MVHQARITWHLAWFEKGALLMLRRLLSNLFSRARSASEHSASFKLQAQTIESAVLPGMLCQDWMGTGFLRGTFDRQGPYFYQVALQSNVEYPAWQTNPFQACGLKVSVGGGETYAICVAVDGWPTWNRKLCSKRCSKVRPFLLGWTP